MSIFKRLLTIALGLFLISTGFAKFNGGYAFQYIEYQSGIDLFYPFLNHATGITEIVAGALILYRPTRLVGSLIASAVLTGAVAFHLSPWLGISPPTGLSDTAAAPWDATDFVSSTSPVVFVMACVTLARSVGTVRAEYRRRQAEQITANEASSAALDLVGEPALRA